MIAAESRGFIFLLGGLAMLTSLALDMSLPALPTLSAQFGAGADTVQLTISLFLLGYAAGQLLNGPASDRFGRRPVLIVGLVVFTIASLASALSWSIGMLIAIRLLHGLGASSGPVLSRAILRDHFGGTRAAQMLSSMMSVMSVAPLLAPFVGGLMLTHFGWRSIFLLITVLGFALLAAGFFGVGESLKHPDHQALRPTRLLANYRAFLGNPLSLGYTLVNGVAFGALFAFISGSPYVLIEVYGVPSEHFGLYFGLTALGFMGGSLVNGRLVRRLRIDGMIRLGLGLLIVTSAILLLMAVMRWGGPLGIVLPFIGVVFSLGLVMPNATAAAMEPLPHMAGNAAAILGATQMTLGALAGYIVNRFYDHTPLPMAEVIAGSAVGAAVLYVLLIRRRRA